MNRAAILINVDDVEAERTARNALLSGAGFVVHDAATAQQALDLVEQHHPDLVLVHLRNGHGKQICSRLKLAPHGTAVAVLQIGATAALSSGADACLTEPVDATVLVATIRAMLRLREAERALREANHRLETANQELRRSNEDFQHFAFVASHDLQQPLRTVTTFLELIEKEAQGRLTETEKGYFAHVVAGANRMRSLIDDLLAYSQIGRENQRRGMVGMSAVVAWAIGDLSAQVTNAGDTIQVAEPLPKVWGDFAQLGQVIRNLLSNAMQYRKPDRPLVIEIGVQELHAHECVVSVRDNGIGMAPEYREKIFAPFQRLHGQEIPGTGMGLAVCRRIVNSHGGSIWVESELDRGSTFFLRLPSAPRTPQVERS